MVAFACGSSNESPDIPGTAMGTTVSTGSGSGTGGPASGASGSGGAGSGNSGGQGGGNDASAADSDASREGDAARTDGASVILTDAGSLGDGNFMISRPFTAAPEMSDHAGVAKGRIVRFTMANSKTFGDGPRAVAVYIPAGYVSGTEVPFMVAQDGVAPQNGGSFGLDDLRPLMDNMIADGRLPAMAGVFVDPASQRSVEYDTVSDRYYRFVEDELLPQAVIQVMMQANLALNLTKDPEGRGAFGGSSGGSCAFTMGWFHPESYRRILTLSGSFVNLQRSMMYPDGAADYYMHLIPESDAKPLRVFLEAGTNDIPGWKNANDAMASVLAAKLYHYRYVVANGASHEDDGARRQYLPDAMLWLWRGYPIKKLWTWLRPHAARPGVIDAETSAASLRRETTEPPIVPLMCHVAHECGRQGPHVDAALAHASRRDLRLTMTTRPRKVPNSSVRDTGNDAGE